MEAVLKVKTGLLRPLAKFFLHRFSIRIIVKYIMTKEFIDTVPENRQAYPLYSSMTVDSSSIEI